MTHINISLYRLYLSFYITSCSDGYYDRSPIQKHVSCLCHLHFIIFHHLSDIISCWKASDPLSILSMLSGLILIEGNHDRHIFNLQSFIDLSSSQSSIPWVYSVWCPCALVLVVRKIQLNPFDALTLVELFLGNGIKIGKDTSNFQSVVVSFYVFIFL